MSPRRTSTAKKIARGVANSAKRNSGISAPIFIILALFVVAFLYGAYLENNPEKIDVISDIIAGFDNGDDTVQTSTETGDIFAGDEYFAVHYIDVGQADCSFVVNGETTMLIDAGEADSSDEIIEYIDDLGVTQIDYVIATHPHADHIGGMAEIIKKYEIGTVIAPKISSELQPTTKTYENFMLALQKKGIRLTASNVGQAYTFADSSKEYDNSFFQILGPVEADYDNLNDWSVAINLKHENTSFVFTGDAEATAESDILGTGLTLNADVLKVGHHGSSSSTSPDFLNAVSPDYAIIQCGADNRYGHPHDETMQILNDNNVTTYRNDLNGNIVAYSNGDDVSISCEK